MNLFYLDKDLKKCAEYHIDAHCNKMILEAAQMLCTAVRQHKGVNVDKLYKATHTNNRMNIWVRTSRENFLWTVNYALALCDEFYFRRGKNHATLEVVNQCVKYCDLFPSIGETAFVLFMPDQYKTDCPVESYRKYYLAEKRFDKNGKNMFTWTKRKAPPWVNDVQNNS
jgi:hypothetical protein